MSNRILSYSGLMADGAIQEILLSTRKGEVGYRIKRFDIITENPGTTAYEHVLKVYKNIQSTATASIDFSDQNLIAVAFQKGDELTYRSAGTLEIIMTNDIFNQDIYITQVDTKDALSCNYYLELEVIKLDESQAMVATLKNIRNNS